MREIDKYRMDGGDTSFLEEQDREYLEAWDQLSEEQRAEIARHGIYGPKLEHRWRVDRTQKAPDIDFIYQKRGLIQQPDVGDATPEERKVLFKAISLFLYAVTAKNHPLNALLAELLVPSLFKDHRDFELEMETTRLVLAKTESEKNLAMAADKFGVVRATVQKRARELREFDIIKKIKSLAHGGSQKASDKAKENANKFYTKKAAEPKCTKPSPFAELTQTTP